MPCLLRRKTGPFRVPRFQKYQVSAPKNAAPSVGIPTNSPYHRGRGRGKGQSKKNSVANTPLNVAFKVTPDPDSPDGVIAAHGGDFNGYVVYVKAGALVFAVRVDKKLTSIQTGAPEEAFTVRARLLKNGAMQLLVNGENVAAGKAAGLIPVEPHEGGSLGGDERTPVGNYAAPFRYTGKVTPLLEK